MTFLFSAPVWLAQLEFPAHWTNLLWTIIAYFVLFLARRERSR